MIDLLHAVHHPPGSRNPIRLNASFRADLAWWCEFLVQRNRISFLPPPSHLPRIEMTSDASGSWGCGAWHQQSWFQVKWDSRAHRLTIAEKELIPIILACDAWGQAWRDRQILCHCDNQVVIACLHPRSSRNPGLMHLLCCLVFVEARNQCSLHPTYITTRDNHLADDLSRDNLSSFLLKVPSADSQATPPSQPLLDLLLDPRADWTSPTWRQQFSTSLTQV